jgi:hypothetical protein
MYVYEIHTRPSKIDSAIVRPSGWLTSRPLMTGFCSLDGMDLLAITPTGSSKTGFYTMYILVALAVLQDPTLCPSAKFPANPCLLVICPTIPLQLDMVLYP